jgi:glycosyltransferase involved in cell wall biosynthesis
MDAVNPPGPSMGDVDVVIPVYNEADCLPELLGRLRAACPGARIIFVDNASTDRTPELLEAEPDVTLVRHDRNLGYGQSLIDGMRAGHGDKVVMIDADLEYQPEDIPAVVEALSRADAVYGSRFLGQKADPEGMNWRRTRGNRLITALFNALYGQHLTDIYTGIRGFRRSALALGEYRRSGFDFVVELSALAALRGARFEEVPAVYRLRSTGSSKMKHFRELTKFVYWVVRDRFRR